MSTLSQRPAKLDAAARLREAELRRRRATETIDPDFDDLCNWYSPDPRDARNIPMAGDDE